MRPRLGVNIDHVATLRQARGELYPSIERAAQIVLANGADQITLHLREDRRHIQDADISLVHAVTKKHQKLFNFELGIDEQIIEIACEQKADWVCLVPEKREERTTEGGLNLVEPNSFKKVQQAVEKLRVKCPKTKISLFVESDQRTLQKCIDLKVDAVEIHTGAYAKDFIDKKKLTPYFENFRAGADQCRGKLGFHAGHGITQESLMPLLELNIFEEYNIGHWIIAESIFDGLGAVVKELKQLME